MSFLHEHVFELQDLPEGTQHSLTTEWIVEGLKRVTVELRFAVPIVPPTIRLCWINPIVDIQHFWHPGSGKNRGLSADWAAGFRTRATYNAPVGCLFNNIGRNRMTFAWSDALNPLSLKAGVNEENAVFRCEVALFEEQAAPLLEYRAELLVDTRDIPYYDALAEVERWWGVMPGYKPAAVPESALVPMYSTWYSFHQKLSPHEVEAQCELARKLGCGAVIVDDGWQTSDNGRGYAYCGDWEVSSEKIPSMKAHVKRVHELGMDYLLWYSVPFVGKESRAWRALSDKMLYVNEALGAGIVDPRYPKVREYLIRTYENAVEQWDLDGLKLDFVDTFRLPDSAERQAPSIHPDMDFANVPDAVDCLLSDVITRLQTLKPNILIEFRQSYTGPLMRKYGNIFRATDCPSDSLTNRVRTLDLRLISGNTAVHSDMIMWHPSESAASAALQIINVLFSVPQISVLIDRLPDDHQEMLAFWLRFWQEHRDILLGGKLEPAHPEMFFPFVKASSEKEILCVSYAPNVVGLAQPDMSYVLVNGTLNRTMVVKAEVDLGEVSLRVQDCRGIVVNEVVVNLPKGLHEIEVPEAGLISIAGFAGSAGVAGVSASGKSTVAASTTRGG
jgi:alpha-galactosidase